MLFENFRIITGVAFNQHITGGVTKVVLTEVARCECQNFVLKKFIIEKWQKLLIK